MSKKQKNAEVQPENVRQPSDLEVQLEQIAFDQAHTLLGTAIKSSDIEMVERNLHVLKRVAVHLLATMIYNRVANQFEGVLNANALQAQLSELNDEIRNCVKWNEMKVKEGVFDHHSFESAQ